MLQSLGIPPYIPGMSSMVPPPGYGSAYGSGLYGPGLYSPGLYGSGLYGSLYGPGLYGYPLYGSSLYGPLSPLFVYGAPLYRSYGTYHPMYGYRGPSIVSGHVGYGYGATRSLGTVRPSVGLGVGRPGIGVGHVGGHR